MNTDKFVGLNIQMTPHPTGSHFESPSFTFFDYDENKNYVQMTLAVERNISAYESHLINTILLLMTNGPIIETFADFSALAFIKKHNLERHFSFSAP